MSDKALRGNKLTRIGFKQGGGSAVWLRGRSGSSNIKAPRGKAGWKQMQDYEAKIPKGQKGYIARVKRIESAGPKELKTNLQNIMGGGRGRPKGGSTKERMRQAKVEDAMREKLLGSLGPKGRLSNRKGGKI